MALGGDLDNNSSLNEHVSYLEVAELWHFAGSSMGLVILPHLPSDIYRVQYSPKSDEDFAVLAKCL